MPDCGVDTSDLSPDPATRPILQRPIVDQLDFRQVLAQQSTDALKDDEARHALDFEKKALLRDVLRPFLFSWVFNSSMTTVQDFQTFAGVHARTKVKTDDDTPADADARFAVFQDPQAALVRRFLSLVAYILALLGATLGGEPFHITAFPFCFWAIDQQLGRFIIYLWVISMYVGQALKDYFHLPRPGVVNPRVRSLEGHYLAEYGFPSTHTMSVMGQACVIVYYTYLKDYAGEGSYPLPLAMLLAATVVTITALGRVYLGVHSVPDIFGGFFFETLVFIGFAHYALWLDQFVTTSSDTLYIPTLVCLAALLIYPRPRRWTNAYGDTAMIAGVGHGVVIGSYLCATAGFPEIPLPWLEEPFWAWSIVAFARALLGFIILILTRQVSKLLMRQILLVILPTSDIPSEQRYAFGVPQKFMTYTVVGLVSVYFVPQVFQLVGLTTDLIDAIATQTA